MLGAELERFHESYIFQVDLYILVKFMHCVKS